MQTTAHYNKIQVQQKNVDVLVLVTSDGKLWRKYREV